MVQEPLHLPGYAKVNWDSARTVSTSGVSPGTMKRHRLLFRLSKHYLDDLPQIWLPRSSSRKLSEVFMQNWLHKNFPLLGYQPVESWIFVALRTVLGKYQAPDEVEQRGEGGTPILA